MPLTTPTVVRGMHNTGTTDLIGGTELNAMTVRLFADFQKYLNPTETPFTSSLSTGKAVDQKKVEWGSSFLVPHQGNLGAAVAAGDTTITLAAGDGAKVMVTEVLKIGTERLWVLSINGDVLTVRRGLSGTAAGTYAAGALVDFMGPAALENADTPLMPVAKGGLEFNVPQLWDGAIGLSEMANNTPDYEFKSGSRYDQYLQKAMKEMAIKFEKQAITGIRRPEVAMTGSTATPSTMGGLDFFTDVSYDLSGAAITENTLASILQDSWTAVGPENMAKTLYVGPFVKRALSSLWNANRIADVKDQKTTLVWREVETDFGTIRFVLSRYIPAGQAFLLNLNDITIHPYKNMAWKEVRLPAAGPYIKGRFTGAYTMVFRNNAARSKIVNVSTNPVDYPNM